MSIPIELVKLGDIARFEMGQSPDSSTVSEAPAGLPFLQGSAEFGAMFPEHKSYCAYPLKSCHPGDTLVSVRAPVGDLNLADRAYCIGRGLAAVHFTEVTPKFGWHLLRQFAPGLRRVAQGSTFEAIGKTELASLQVAFVPPSEQRRIAEILDTVDEAIRKTEQIIAKLKQIKAGLLHDLLTRGIDANGNLRDPITHPEQFKDSPLGRIPREWEVGGIERLATNHDAKRVPLKQAQRDLMNGEYPYYGASGVIDYVDDYLFDGDFILLGEDGENIVSRALPLAFRVSGRFWVNNHAHIYEPNTGTDIDFFTELLEAQDYGAIMSGSAQPKLTQRVLNHLTLAIPPPMEQKRIGDCLQSVSRLIDEEYLHKDKVIVLKLGLMNDLLTGRVRVDVVEEVGEMV